ncbi:MAG: transport permease protein [Planctomycetota bacterium]|nr:MAG: transport permease protein [Planctomycetota bacterium]
MKPLRQALAFPAVMFRHHELLVAFVHRELKARIEGSMLGRLWPIIQPVMLFAIYYLVFAKILKIGFSDTLAPHGEGNEGWRSTFYLVTGILPWTVLAEGLTRGSGVVLENANLIKKIAFPSELLPTYTTVVFHVYFLLGMAILLIMQLAVVGSLPAALVWFPLILFLQFLFVNGVAMFLSASNIFVRDISQAVPVLVTFWMFTTPVFYDPGHMENLAADHHAALIENVNHQEYLAAQGDPDAHVEEAVAARDEAAQKHEALSTITYAMSFNPMAGLLDMYRAIFSHGKVPVEPGKVLRFGIIALVVQWLGYAWFLRCKGRFADEV